jgi:hypothetical protein
MEPEDSRHLSTMNVILDLFRLAGQPLCAMLMNVGTDRHQDVIRFSVTNRQQSEMEGLVCLQIVQSSARLPLIIAHHPATFWSEFQNWLAEKTEVGTLHFRNADPERSNPDFDRKTKFLCHH